MKRRAQTGAAPQATKKKKVAEDNEEAEHLSAPIPTPRVTKASYASSPSSSSSRVHIIDDHSSSSSSTVSHNSHDNLSSPVHDVSSLHPPTRYHPLSQPTSTSNPARPTNAKNSHVVKPAGGAAKASFAQAGSAAIILAAPPPASSSQKPSYTICWARVNRSPWWPGKLLFGDDIPEDLRDKKHTSGYQCVELYNREERGWVNPDRIVPFAEHPSGPEERKRPPVPPLAVAIELATADLKALPRASAAAATTSAQPRNSPNPAKKTAKSVASTTALATPSSSTAPQPPTTQTSHKPSPTTPVASTTIKATGSAAKVSSASTIATSKATLLPQHQAYIHPIDAKMKTLGYGRMEPATTAGVSTRSDRQPAKPLPATLSAYLTTSSKVTASAKVSAANGPSTPVAKTTAATSSSAHKTTDTKAPQAVHPLAVPTPMSAMASSTISTQNAIRPASVLPAKLTGAKAAGRPRKDTSNTASGREVSALHTNSSTPVSMVAIETISETASTQSTRAPSPVRSTAHTYKIGEPAKPVEEFNTYKGSACVGHVITNKPNALMSGSRASSQVDALTVVSSLRYRASDGQVMTAPVTEKHYIGMQNLGNTCYINSAIQCLAQVSSFLTPLIEMDVLLEDALVNSTSPLVLQQQALKESKEASKENADSRTSRSRALNHHLLQPSLPPVIDKKNRTRRSMLLASHNSPEDAKSNPLIASLVGTLKVLHHPDYLIQHSDKNPNHLYAGNMGLSNQSRASALLKATNALMNGHGYHPPHLIHSSSSDEEMDVDPINVDDDEETDEEGDELVPSKDVTKVLHAFQNSSGQLLDEKYYTDQHQDISEFMLHLLEYTHDQLNTRKSLAAPPTPNAARKRGVKSSTALESPRTLATSSSTAMEVSTTEECKEWTRYMAGNQSPVTNSFDGLLRRTRKCPKDHTFVSYEIFRILTLHFEDENAKECTLEDMFETFRKPEFLSCRCSTCGGTDDKDFSQVTDVYMLPKYLIITLGRFKGSASDQSWWAHKIKTRVKFPLDRLDLAPLFDVAPGQPAPIYNLVAVSNHKGSSIQGGHYYSYVRSWPSAEHWVCLNDTTVKEVRTDAIVSNQAYMLFYERQDQLQP